MPKLQAMETAAAMAAATAIVMGAGTYLMRCQRLVDAVIEEAQGSKWKDLFFGVWKKLS